jgi:hypothetical protein
MGKSAPPSIVPASLRLRDDSSSNRGTQQGKNAVSDLVKGTCINAQAVPANPRITKTKLREVSFSPRA